MGCKYLLVQLEDASDEGIEATSGLAGTLVGNAAIPLLPIAATAHHLANVLRPGCGPPCGTGCPEGTRCRLFKDRCHMTCEPNRRPPPLAGPATLPPPPQIGPLKQ